MTRNADDAGGRGGRMLTRAEMEELLGRGFWGVLATARADEPYGVPIIYAWDGDALYFASGPGRKVEFVESNPSVTLTVVELEDYGRRWQSVIVRGQAHFVEELTAKLHAFNALRKQIPRPVARARDAAKLAAAKVVRIEVREMTGRAVGY